uniref:Uncharacterized protein n=1 Tax=Rhizophora mucronata TaxID=61149 RepID=A0A2P2NVP7_RHIMU
MSYLLVEIVRYKCIFLPELNKIFSPFSPEVLSSSIKEGGQI